MNLDDEQVQAGLRLAWAARAGSLADLADARERLEDVEGRMRATGVYGPRTVN